MIQFHGKRTHTHTLARACFGSSTKAKTDLTCGYLTGLLHKPRRGGRQLCAINRNLQKSHRFGRGVAKVPIIRQKCTISSKITRCHLKFVRCSFDSYWFWVWMSVRSGGCFWCFLARGGQISAEAYTDYTPRREHVPREFDPRKSGPDSFGAGSGPRWVRGI